MNRKAVLLFAVIFLTVTWIGVKEVSAQTSCLRTVGAVEGNFYNYYLSFLNTSSSSATGFLSYDNCQSASNRAVNLNWHSCAGFAGRQGPMILACRLLDNGQVADVNNLTLSSNLTPLPYGSSNYGKTVQWSMPNNQSSTISVRNVSGGHDYQVECLSPGWMGSNYYFCNSGSMSVSANNAQCGQASRTYSADETGYTQSFCSVGEVNGSNPSFPAVNSTVNWTCNGTGGGASASCSAYRSSDVITLYDDPADGVCGEAQRTYASTDTGFVMPFCSVGSLLGSNPAFPAPGSTAYWSCQGVNGGDTTSCSAYRSSVPIGFCGNNTIDSGEQCDGSATGSCSNGCNNSTCQCLPAAYCGNNIVEGTEQCDGSALGSCSYGCDGSCQCADDTIPPITTAYYNNSTNIIEWYTDNVQVSLRATDNLSGVQETRICIDQTNTCTPTTGTTGTVTFEGSSYVRYFSIDRAGNIEFTHSDEIRIDKTPPDASADNTNHGFWYNLLTRPKINITAFDALSGLAWTNFTWDDSDFSRCTNEGIDLDAEPIAYWKLDETSGVDVADSSGNHHDGTASGPTITTGQINNARNFVNDTDIININNSAGLDLTGNFKIEAWVNRTDSNLHTMGVVSKYNEGESGGYALLVGNRGEVYCRTFNDAGDRSDSFSDYDDPRNITVGSGWHKIAAERFGSTCRVYIDDVDVTNDFGDHSEVGVSNAGVQLGGGINTYSDITNFLGKIDEVKIFDFVPKHQISLPEATAKWTMNENLGDSVADVSGNGNDGLADGTSIIDGINSFARDFNGTSDYILVDDPQTIPVGNDPRTVSLWFNSNIAYGSKPVTLFQYGSTNMGEQFSLIVRSDWEPGKLYFWGHWADAVINETLAPNTWYHATVSYDGTNIRMYLNGVLKSQAAINLNTVMDSNNFRIGNGVWNSDVSFWDGEIDELKIYDVALSDAQVEADYLASKPAPNKIGWWPMNEPSGSDVADNSGNNNPGVATGTTIDDGIKGNARNFTGGTDRVSVADSDLWDFGNDDFSVSYWVYHTDPVGIINAHVINGTNHFGGQASWYIRRWSNGAINILLSNNGSSWSGSFHGTKIITSDQWHFITMVRHGNEIEFYVDGQKDPLNISSYSTSILAVNDELTIGNEKSAGGTFANAMYGSIDDVKIYDSALTATEILNEYNGNSVNHNFSAQINIVGEGRHNLHICAADNAGWNRTWSGEYNLDITPPFGGSVNIANLDVDDYTSDFNLSLDINRGDDSVSGMSNSNSDYLLEVSSVPLVTDTCIDLGNTWVDANVNEIADSSSYLLNAAINTCYQFRYIVKDQAGNETIYVSNIAKVGDTPSISPLFNSDTMESGNLQVLLTDSRPEQKDHITVSYQNSIAQTITDGSLKLTVPTEFDLTALTAEDVSIGGSDVTWGTPIVDVGGKTIVFPFVGDLDDTDGLITVLIGETNFVINPENTGSYKFFMAGYVSNDGTGDSVEEYTADVAIMDGVTVTAMIPSSLTFSVFAVASGEMINGETVNVDSEVNLINYGVIEPASRKIASHDLRVSTNAADGFEVTLQTAGELAAANGDLIAAFPGTNLSPVEWSIPGMGYHGFFGYTTDDETLGSSPVNRFSGSKWAGPSDSPQEVMYHFKPVDSDGQGEGVARVGYQIEIDDLQPAGVYQNELIYICTATF